MHITDVVTYQDKRWLVTSLKPGKLCVLHAWDGAETEVPATFDKDPDSGLKVVAEASKWPFMTAPMRAKAGPIVQVAIGQNILIPLTDWVPSDVTRPGGPIYFNPALRLELGVVLVAKHKNGSLTRLKVNMAFASVRLRQERTRLANQPPVRRSVYERLMDDDEYEDP